VAMSGNHTRGDPTPEASPQRYQAVLFDMGYTLVYFEPPQEAVVQAALRTMGAERSVDQILAAVQVVWGRYYQDAETRTFPATKEHDRETQFQLEAGLLEELGLKSDRETWRLFNAVVDDDFGQPGAIRPYPETMEVVESLHQQGYRLGIISNWSWNLRERVQQAGLDGYFEITWASAYAGCNKPHPRIFEQALAQMALPAHQAYYVGDSYRHDILGARAAGLDAALLDRDGTAAVNDCPVIRDLRGLSALLEKKSNEPARLPGRP
jgi:putative hydrolase of the HAD superfamily